MIFLQLTRREAEHGPLPSVCVRCGAPAFVWHTRRMRPQRPEVSALYYGAFPAFLILWTFLVLTWSPGDDELLEMVIWFGIIAAMLANIFAPWFAASGLEVRLPFCEKHHLHWFKWTVYDLVCPLFLACLVVGSIMRPRMPLLFSLMLLHLMQWLVVKTVARHRAIQVNELTDQHITLRGIHADFREALFRLRKDAKAKTADVAATPETGTPNTPEASIGVQP